MAKISKIPKLVQLSADDTPTALAPHSSIPVARFVVTQISRKKASMLPSSKRVFNSTSQPVVFVLSRKMAPIRLSRRRGSSSRNYSIFPEIITPSPSETILTVPASFRLNLSSSRIATRGSATIFFFGVIFLPSLEIEEVMDVDFDFADFEVSVDDFVTVFLKINALGRAIFINPDDILAGKALCEMINTSVSPIDPEITALEEANNF